MKIFVNDRGEIHDVHQSSDPSLTEIEVTDGTFDDWSDAKICCYCVAVQDGEVIMRTPYVSTKLIDKIDRLGNENKTQAVEIEGLGDAIIEMSEILYS